MYLLRSLPLLAAGFSLACSSSAPIRAPQQPTLSGDYQLVTPEVSLSRTAQEVEEHRAALDPRADVMAEILAIPPGR